MPRSSAFHIFLFSLSPFLRQHRVHLLSRQSALFVFRLRSLSSDNRPVGRYTPDYFPPLSASCSNDPAAPAWLERTAPLAWQSESSRGVVAQEEQMHESLPPYGGPLTDKPGLTTHAVQSAQLCDRSLTNVANGAWLRKMDDKQCSLRSRWTARVRGLFRPIAV